MAWTPDEIYPEWRMRALVRSLENAALYPNIYRVFHGLGTLEQIVQEHLTMIEQESDRRRAEEVARG